MGLIPKGDLLGNALIVVDAIGTTLAVVAVSLRLWARRRSAELCGGTAETERANPRGTRIRRKDQGFHVETKTSSRS